MQAFFVSLFAGVGFPLLPVWAEYGLSHVVHSETYALTGIVYVAAVGMASRQQAVGISSLFCATICAIIYGAVKLGGNAHVDVPFIKYASIISGAFLFFYAGCWSIERFGRHYVDREPFLEF
jgi:hypothetical protein